MPKLADKLADLPPRRRRVALVVALALVLLLWAAQAAAYLVWSLHLQGLL